MKVGPYIGWIVAVIVFASAMLGMLIRRTLPESHLSDETKGVVTLSMGVVGTLTALVLSLLIATASNTFNTRSQEITVLAAKVIQLERLLRRYGPEADLVVRCPPQAGFSRQSDLRHGPAPAVATKHDLYFVLALTEWFYKIVDALEAFHRLVPDGALRDNPLDRPYRGLAVDEAVAAKDW
jgi:hypothetical protein